GGRDERRDFPPRDREARGFDRRDREPRDRDTRYERAPRDRESVDREGIDIEGVDREGVELRDTGREDADRARYDREPSRDREPGGQAVPELDEEFRAEDLDPEVRAELRGMARSIADTVARRLVATGRLLDDDPETALAHAVAARRLA